MNAQGLNTFLRSCRERAGFSQEKIGELLHRTKSCISKIESNKKVLDAQTLFQWVEVTGSKEALIAFMYGMDGIQMVQNVMTIIGG